MVVRGGSVVGTETQAVAAALVSLARQVAAPGVAAAALDTYRKKWSLTARRRIGATNSHTAAQSVILPSEQAIVEGDDFKVGVGTHRDSFQRRQPCAQLVPVLKRAAWLSYGEIGREATE